MIFLIPFQAIVRKLWEINVDNNAKNGSVGGQITVFLTLILLILLSFFTAAIESARMSALNAFSEKNLRLAVQGAFTEYCRPLWEDYHLFMLEGDGDLEGRIGSNIETYQSSITGNLFSQENQEFKICSMEPFLEEGGNGYINQIAAYMKYHVADSHFLKNENLEEKRGMVEKQAAEELEDLNEIEQEAELDSSLIKVIELVEGVTISKGRIKTKHSFIKQICSGEVTSENVGIRNQDIFHALKSKYRRPEEVSILICVNLLRLIDTALEEIYQMEQKKATLTSNSLNEMYYQVIGMKTTLKSNRSVLESCLKSGKQEEIKTLLTSYQIQPLTFYYGTLSLKEKPDPISAVKKSFASNLVSLVVEKEEGISDRKLPDPFKLSNSKKEKEAFSVSSFSKMSKKNNKKTEECLDWFTKDSLLDKSSKIMFEVAYYQTHFSNYLTSPKNVFQYEQEYIIGGGSTEREALGIVLNKIVLQRGMINFMYLLTDKEKSQKAYITALSLVGFSGMQALIETVKLSILLCWAMAEGIIDVAILLQGKTISYWKDKQNFLLRYEELFAFGKAKVLEKAKQYKGVKTGGLTYGAFLKELLYLQKREFRVNHSLALIEETMKQSYVKDFSMEKGVVGLSVEGAYTYHKNKEINVTVNYSY